MEWFRGGADALSEAVAGLRASPLRASLAALATAAAVGTIVIVVTGLDAIASYARETGARTFGGDTFVIAQVASTQLNRRELAARLERNPPIKPSDFRYLERLGGDILYAPVAQRTGDVVAGSRRFEGAALNGTHSTLADIRVIELAAGRFIAAHEVTRAAQVVVLGADVAATLFPATNPIGRPVRIAGRRFDVVGIVARQGSAGGVTLDRYAYLPLGAWERAFGAMPSLQIFARPMAGLSAVEIAEGRARAGLRARRQLRPGEADTFDVITPEAARTFVLTLAGRIGAAGLPISVMALMAAVVVIANTVLVSVTQRMREIGIRRALGARRARIVAEVLAESMLVAGFGGAAGIAAAAALLAIAGRLSGLTIAPRMSTVVIAVAAAALSGILAGYYPARQASRMDVMAALRLE